MSKETEAFVAKYATKRHGTNSLKWDALQERYGDPDLIAMWVADMEFRTPEVVTDALTKRIAQGIYGYSFTPDSYYDAYFTWQKQRHNIDLKKEWLRFDNGVVNSLYGIINTFTEPDDAVMILTPVYYPFHNAVKDNHRKLVTSELQRDDAGLYTIDFADVEAKIKANQVKLLINCSPHNPVGRIWTEAELKQLLTLCRQYHVLVVSDEIHQDIEIGSRPFISALNVDNGAYNDELIVVTAPSKTFNLASLLNSHVIIPDEKIRAQYDAGKKRFNETEISLLGQVAAEAAYQNGGAWLDSLLAVIRENEQYVRTELGEKVPAIKIAPLEGTYLLWLDLRELVPVADTKTFIQDKCRIAVDFGQWFGEKDAGFVRFNLATDPANVKQAVANVVKQASLL